MFLQDMTYPGGTRVLSWRLVEETSQLMALCREADISCEDLAELPDKRQREKAAERLLLCRAFGRPVVLCHDKQGAPSVKDETTNISITHTIHMVALAVNDSQVIGIDAEQADRKQVVRVRDKFLNAGEQSFIAPDDLTAHVIAWTAKEAIIKAERNSALDWTDGIILDPFTVPEQDFDEITFTARTATNRYRMVVRPVGGHFLTLAAALKP